MEGATKEEFLKELDEVRDELKNLSENIPSDKHVTKKYHAIPSVMPTTPYLSLTLLFLFLFFISIQSKEIPYVIIALSALVIAVLSGVQHVALSFRKQKTTLYEYMVCIVLIFTLAIAYFVAWPLLQTQLFFVLATIGTLLLVATIFFLLHAYFGYLRRIASYETGVTALIMMSAWVLFFLSLLYQNPATLLLVIISLVLFGKASIDFSERFREKSK